MLEVPLTQRKVALIDDEDGPRVLQFKWTLLFSPRNGKYYARRSEWLPGGKSRTIYLQPPAQSATRDELSEPPEHEMQLVK